MDGYYGTCPECRRNDELAEEQRSIAFAQTAEQERIQRQVQEEAHLNEIKRKLLELALESVDDRDGVEKKASILMRSSDFAANLHWFWTDVSGNEFLSNSYYSTALGPLVSANSTPEGAVSFFDGLDQRVREGLEPWLEKQTSDSVYCNKILPLHQSYQQVVKRREIEQQRRNEENSRNYAAEQARRDETAAREKTAAEAAESSRKSLVAVGAIISALLWLAGVAVVGFIAAGGLNTITEAPLANAKTSLAVFILLALIGSKDVFVISRAYLERNSLYGGRCSLPWSTLVCDFVNNPKAWLYWSAACLLLLITAGAWKDVEGWGRVVMLGSVFALPLVPFVRGSIGSFVLGIAGGLVSLIVASIAGWILSGIFGWIMTSSS